MSRVALRRLASGSFESLSGSSKLSDETAVRSISIGAAWLASMSTTWAVSSDSSRCSERSARKLSNCSFVGSSPYSVRKHTSS